MMKVVIIGGTGLTGSKLVKKLQADGHDALAASPNTGVDVISGKGLAGPLTGAQVVVDVSNAPNWDDGAVIEFIQTSVRNVLDAETAAGVGHHVALSVVETERLQPSGSFRAKLDDEQAGKAAVIPTTILLATVLADLAENAALNGTVELGGPGRLRLNEFVPGDDAHIGTTGIAQWLSRPSAPTPSGQPDRSPLDSRVEGP